eukprot:11807390-Alexandrium_andersonii.AAC.1
MCISCSIACTLPLLFATRARCIPCVRPYVAQQRHPSAPSDIVLRCEWLGAGICLTVARCQA